MVPPSGEPFREGERSNMRYKYIIVGGGLAGASAIEGIRDLDKDGSILLISKEKHLPYHRPPLSKSLWTGKKKVIDIFVKNQSFYDDNGVCVLLEDEIVGLDAKNKSISSRAGECYEFDKLLIATGGEPRKLQIQGGEENGVFYFRNLDHYLALEPACRENATALVIGGGFIGTELAAALSSRKVGVTMLFPENRPGYRIFPEYLGLHILQMFRERGMKIVTRDKPAVIEKAKGKYLVQCESGKQLEAEIIIAGAGIMPSVGLAESAGLAVQNGIVVNSLLQTSHPDIYSAGDNTSFAQAWSGVQNRVEHWDNAMHQGRLAGKNMAGAGEPYDYMPYFFSDLFDLGYEAVGEIDSRLETYADWQEENKKGAIYYLRDKHVKGVLLCNIWEKLNDARALIKKGAPVIVESLRGAIR
jgi:3-phenylpropionate/trans-cinnamate dioxygenase ferredoxin reductase component